MFDHNRDAEFRPDCLESLAGMSQQRGGEALELAQSQLEERLRPIVRLALRKGEGIPEVVGWVRRAQANLVDNISRPDQGAAEIARMLSVTLLHARRLLPRSSAPRHADTVVGI
jgi:hypothetical protein